MELMSFTCACTVALQKKLPFSNIQLRVFVACPAVLAVLDTNLLLIKALGDFWLAGVKLS